MITKTPRFLDLYLAGEAAPGEIDDFLDAWHAGPGHVQAHVHLGMTLGEYLTWLREGWLPTPAEHAAERIDAIYALDADGEPETVRVHSPIRCRPPCPIHWPSPHPLAAAPIRWDGDQGVIYRICSHGQSHPDPDDQQVRLHPELAGHECDGCCRAVIIEGEPVWPAIAEGAA